MATVPPGQNDPLSAERRLSDVLNLRVVRGSLQNLETAERREFLLNPTELEEVYRTNWVKHRSPGLSHSRIQFGSGENAVIPLTLFYDQLMVNGTRTIPDLDPEELESGREYEVENHRKFLLSLCHPRRSQRIMAASPPPVLFSWPGMIRMRVRIEEIRFRHIMFKSGTPRPRIYVAEISMFEDPVDRIYSEDVRNQGTLRSSASSLRSRFWNNGQGSGG